MFKGFVLSLQGPVGPPGNPGPVGPKGSKVRFSFIISLKPAEMSVLICGLKHLQLSCLLRLNYYYYSSLSDANSYCFVCFQGDPGARGPPGEPVSTH